MPITSHPPELVHGFQPGLIGEITRAHALYYGAAWSFPLAFEAKVARELSAFAERFDSTRDAIIHAARGATFLGAVAVDGSDPALTAGQAHLRWFIVTDGARGDGLGGRLFGAATDALRRLGHRSCYLTTFAGLDAAHRLYDRAGFVLTDEREGATWGRVMREQRFDLVL
jgi:GNAT superfamily N-acetyltransferase